MSYRIGNGQIKEHISDHAWVLFTTLAFSFLFYVISSNILTLVYFLVAPIYIWYKYVKIFRETMEKELVMPFIESGQEDIKTYENLFNNLRLYSAFVFSKGLLQFVHVNVMVDIFLFILYKYVYRCISFQLMASYTRV